MRRPGRCHTNARVTSGYRVPGRCRPADGKFGTVIAHGRTTAWPAAATRLIVSSTAGPARHSFGPGLQAPEVLRRPDEEADDSVRLVIPGVTRPGVRPPPGRAVRSDHPAGFIASRSSFIRYGENPSRHYRVDSRLSSRPAITVRGRRSRHINLGASVSAVHAVGWIRRSAFSSAETRVSDRRFGGRLDRLRPSHTSCARPGPQQKSDDQTRTCTASHTTPRCCRKSSRERPRPIVRTRGDAQASSRSPSVAR
jgi:hypothetical protein